MSDAIRTALAESIALVSRMTALMPGNSILSFYVALLQIAKTMERRYPDLRPVRDVVFDDPEAN